MATELLKTPPYAPGHLVAESLRDAVRVMVTPSAAFSAVGDGTITTALVRVPANTLIIGVLAEVTTAFNGTAPIYNFGDSDNAVALWASSDLTTPLASTGFKGLFNGKEYTAAQDLIATFANASSDSSAGAMRFWLLYSTEIDKRRVKST